MQTEAVELSVLVGQLERMIDEAKVVLLTRQVRVDRREMKDVIDRIRVGLAKLQGPAA